MKNWIKIIQCTSKIDRMRLLVTTLLCAAVSAMQIKSMFVKQFGLSDLITSASGYVYHGTSGGPTSYMYFNPNLPKQVIQPDQSGFFKMVKPLPVLYAATKPEEDYGSKENIEILNDGLENEEEEENHYETRNGQDNNSGYHSQNGEKSVVDYNKNHAYDKGQKGSFENQNHKNQYQQNGGNKNGYYDSADGYKSQHSEGKGSKGGNFEVSGYHNKGQKTTGYHKVYHKDEYKKDHTFYDESDKKGHYSKYGNAENKHQAEVGGRKLGGNSASGYRNNLYGKQGFAEQGRNDAASNGHDNASGRETYESGRTTFAENGDKGDSRQYGYSVK